MKDLNLGLVKVLPILVKSVSAAFLIPIDSVLLVVRLLGHQRISKRRIRNCQKKKRAVAVAGESDSEESYSNSSRGQRSPYNSNGKVQSFSPSTPPPTAVKYRTVKRRKGIPHRSPMGGLVIEY